MDSRIDNEVGLDQLLRVTVDDQCNELAIADRTFAPDDVERGRIMAVFCHFSVMFGLPVFVIPFLLRDNAFVLHHAKAAGVIYLLCTAWLAAALLNCALFLPFAFLCYIPALIGIHRASAGVEAGSAALGRTGESVFKWIEKVK